MARDTGTRVNVGDPLVRARDAGIRHLLARQQPDGAWQDYTAFPIGPATEWVTGFASSALADVGGAACDLAVRRGAASLLAARPEGAGWGFNASVGPDADSTAWALTTLRAAGTPSPLAASRFLDSLRRPDGGYATYPRTDGWGRSHPDVTAVVLLALPPEVRVTVADDAIRFASRAADPDGTWPTYWWRGRHYATYWNRAMLTALGHAPPPMVSWSGAAGDPSRTIETAFDLAWVLAIAVLDRDPPPAIRALATLLIERQRPDGSWPGGDDLRVTAPQWHHAGIRVVGRRYEDDQRIITTASAVRALHLAVGATR